MLDLLTQEPRLVVGALVGFLVGLGGAYALHTYLPGASPLAGAAIAALGLVLGLVLGAKWEASRS